MAFDRPNPVGARFLAVVRIVIGIFFLFFAEYKLASGEFAHKLYAGWVNGYIKDSALAFYKPFLRWTVAHQVFSGYAVAVTELLIGLSMVLGYWVRVFALVGAAFMLNLVFCTWNAPGPGPFWRYLGNELDNIPLLMLFLLFFAYRAGETWGLDGRRRS